MSRVQRKIPFKKYDNPVELEISSLDDEGQGIAFYDGYEIYLKGALPGERLLALIREPFANGSRRRRGEIVSFVSKSADRDESHDILFNEIYPYGHLKYEATLRLKQDKIIRSLENAGIKPDTVQILDIERSYTDRAVRFKSIRYFGRSNGRIISGFFRPRSHEVFEVDKSYLEPEWISLFCRKLCDEFNSKGIQVYDESLKKGLLRSITFRDSLEQRMCILSCAYEPDESFRISFKKLCCDFDIDAIFININETEGNRILSDKTICLSENDFIRVKLCDFEYRAGPYTFLQVNYDIANKLYSHAVAWCGEDMNGRALDLCCGVGTMTLPLSRKFLRVTGVEIVPQSIDAARVNALDNGIANADFVVGDIKKICNDFTKFSDIRAIICDPSRVGIGEKACIALSRIKGPLKLAYIFCSLKALERDVKTLCEHGFSVKMVKGFDMFPYTSHVETLVLMSKVKE